MTDGQLHAQRPRRRHRIAIVIAAPLAALVVAGAALWPRVMLPPHFAVAGPDDILRGGQPAPRHLWHLQRRHGLATVVNLRSREEEAGEPAEPAWCSASGVEYAHIPVDDIPRRAHTLEFLHAMQARRGAVLIHCQHGRNRTGKMIAAYRVVLEGRTPREAYDEMLEYGFLAREDPGGQVMPWLEQLAAEREAIRAELASHSAP